MNKFSRFGGAILVAGVVLVALVLVMPLATLAMTSGFIYVALGAVGLGLLLYLVWRWIDFLAIRASQSPDSESDSTDQADRQP